MQTADGCEDDLFLGLDSSTQTLKALLMDARLSVRFEAAVNFDRDLPEFKTEGGVHRHADGLTVTSPPILWVAAFDRLLEKLKAGGCDLRRVAAISGSGQQHGSVWLKRNARAALRGLNSRRPLRDQLAAVFSVADSPVWMDSSTTRECAALEKALGGAQAVADLTGSRAYERFTGNQIAKIFRTRPDAYAATDRIALVSSFVASLLIGDYAPIDAADGSGMNLMDIRSKTWSPRALAATAPDLAKRLGRIAPSHKVVGRIHPYYARRFGFNSSCAIVAFSGDNPCSLAGLRLQQPGDLALSLGTSDTLFGSLSDPRPSGAEGHVFASPVDPKAYMAMVCRKNGSLTREDVRNRSADRSWEVFRRLMDTTPPGNDGHIGLYILEPEITPPILKTGVWRFDARGKPARNFAAAVEARAVIESQFLCMRLHGASIGLKPASILATGGASVDAAVLRVVADVFGVTVCVGEQPNSAALGAAYRALHGWLCRRRRRFVRFADVVADAPPFKKAMEPDRRAHAAYTKMLAKYAGLERKVAGA
jgi:xylulokinase